jgi:hypothetical protein
MVGSYARGRTALAVSVVAAVVACAHAPTAPADFRAPAFGFHRTFGPCDTDDAIDAAGEVWKRGACAGDLGAFHRKRVRDPALRDRVAAAFTGFPAPSPAATGTCDDRFTFWARGPRGVQRWDICAPEHGPGLPASQLLTAPYAEVVAMFEALGP